jgi:hypothetical protein
MNSFYRSAPVTSSAVAEDERRYNERNKFLTRVQIRPLNRPGPQQLGTTQDLSRDGLYFVVRSQQFNVGMQLLVSLPDAKSEWTCEVVRTEPLPNGGQGVAVVRIAGS